MLLHWYFYNFQSIIWTRPKNCQINGAFIGNSEKLQVRRVGLQTWLLELFIHVQ